MTSKRDEKRKRREKRKKNNRKVKSGKAILLDRIRKSELLSKAQIAEKPQDTEKMPEVLLDFVSPLLDVCEDDETEKKAMEFSITVWNAYLLPEKDQDKLIQELISGLSPSSKADDLAMSKYYVDMLMERKKKYFPNNKRLIVDYQISGSRKKRHLSVASTFSP